jgi:hypothetical protein
MHNFFLDFVFEEKINDLGLFDGDGESEDFFEGSNFLVFDESSEFGNWLPFIGLIFGSSFLVFSSSSGISSASSESSSASFSFFSHFDI